MLLRVCQEAINNTVKYAGAENIKIDMNVEENTYAIQIQDDGIGFNLETVKRGYGLNNMEERMVEIGGNLEIQSELKVGTTLLFTGPIQKKYEKGRIAQ